METLYRLKPGKEGIIEERIESVRSASPGDIIMSVERLRVVGRRHSTRLRRYMLVDGYSVTIELGGWSRLSIETVKGILKVGPETRLRLLRFARDYETTLSELVREAERVGLRDAEMVAGLYLLINE